MNTIALAKRYTDCVNEVYVQSAKSAVLETDSALSREGGGANEIVIPSLSLDGLGDYSRNAGYVHGNVKLTWSTVRYNYERGRMFEVDAMDNEESQNVAFGRLAGEFMRTRAVPELDAFRFARIINTEDIGLEMETLSTGDAAVASIRKAINALDAAEVPDTERILFISPAVKALIDDMDTTKSRAVMDGFEQVVTVPAGRFYASVTLNDGTTAGEEGGGFEGEGAVNYLIVHRPAVLCFTKHLVSKVIPPESNPDSDAYRYGFRSYGLCTVLSGREAGIYCSMAE